MTHTDAHTLDKTELDARRIVSLWKIATEDVHRLVLDALAIPQPAKTPVEYAKNALANLKDDEWQEVCDWLAENHWLPPGN